MSHFTEIKTQIKDIEALRLACQELGLTRIYHDCIEQRSGESVRRLDITQPNENATHRFFCDRL